MNKNSLKIAFGWGPGHIWLHTYTWGSMTTLHDFVGALDGLETLFFFWALTISWSWVLARVWSGPKTHLPYICHTPHAIMQWVTSYTTQEPWPWNCESPKESAQRDFIHRHPHPSRFKPLTAIFLLLLLHRFLTCSTSSPFLHPMLLRLRLFDRMMIWRIM